MAILKRNVEWECIDTEQNIYARELNHGYLVAVFDDEGKVIPASLTFASFPMWAGTTQKRGGLA